MSIKRLAAGFAVGVTLLFGASAYAADEAPAAAYAAKGENTCLKCHDSQHVADILQTPHAMKGDSRTPFGQHACESCHGASPEHVASARKVTGDEKPVPPAIVFNGPNKSPVEARNGACLTCHQNNARINWQRGAHSNNDIACTNCHTSHVTKDPVLVKATQPEKCFTCHAQQRAESLQYSHHPIREGKVVCADCHSVHGSPSAAPGLLKEITLNETCYNCHADKRGPMLFEHEPVRENCDYCHTPHGSPQARLLSDRIPYACIACHSADSHQTPGASYLASTGNSTSFFGSKCNLPGQPINTTGCAPTNTIQARACLNCHSNIHGSNSPGGFYFFR